MSDLKIYVFDHDWAGADIYVTASEEKAMEYFLSDNIETCEEGLRLHMRDHPNQLPNPWPEHIEYWKSGNFWNDVQVYDIVEGLEISTTGDY